MSSSPERETQRWAGRPVAALAIKTVVFVVPIVLSALATHLVSKVIARPPGLGLTILWWVGLSIVATGVLFVADRAARRLLPLAALLQLSLVFPDRAPSRFKAALKTQTVHQLKERVAALQATGLPDDPVVAAETLIELVADLSAHDRLTRGHAERVRAYSRMIGEELDLGRDELDRLHWAGLLHDVGKLFVPGEILNKPGRLTDEEFDVIKKHPVWGAELCEPLRGWLGEWVDAVGEHHERWDGRGYPSGIAGAEISLAARIVSVADVYDVITSARSYKAPSTAVEGREELARCAGTQFDPRVVRAFLGISLGRLRLVMGPLSWLAQLPVVGRMPLSPAAGAVVSGAATAVTLVAGGLIDRTPADPPAMVEAAAIETAIDTTPPTTIVLPTLETTPTTTVAPPTTSTIPTTTTTTTTTTPATVPVVTPTSAPLRVVDTAAPPVTTTSPSRIVVTPPPPGDTAAALPPVAVDDDVAGEEGASIVIDVAANDARVTSASLQAPPLVGTVTRLSATAFVFQPPTGWSGQTSFRYAAASAEGVTSSARVTITVSPRPDAPVANDDTATVDEDGSVSVPVLINDTDADGDTLVVVAATSSDGTASTDGTNVFYSPTPNSSGLHSVSYEVSDGTGLTATATVFVTVEARPDDPVAVDDTGAVDEDGSVTLPVLANDSDADGDPLTIITVTATGGIASTDGATVTYTPAPDSFGTHTLTYKIGDGTGRAATATVTIDVSPTPDAPIAANDVASVDEDGTVVVAVLANDGDVDGDSLSVVAVSTHDGVVTTDGTTVTYTPDPDSFGLHTISYTVDDGTGMLASATVSVTVVPQPDAPVASDDAYSTLQAVTLNTPVPGVQANDSDEDGDALSTTVDTPPSNGTVTMLSNGSFVYVPDAAFVGTDTFTYVADDGTGRSDTATVSITVSSSTVENALFLGTGGPSSSNWMFTTTAPDPADPEPDHDLDGSVGLTIERGSEDLTETNPREYQHWNIVPASDLVLNGPVRLELWSTAHEFDENKDVDYSVWLLDCAADGTGCVTLASSVDVHVDDWNGGVADWAYREITVGSVDHTVVAGRMLRLRLMFGHDDVWVALSGNRPSRLVFMQPV